MRTVAALLEVDMRIRRLAFAVSTALCLFSTAGSRPAARRVPTGRRERVLRSSTWILIQLLVASTIGRIDVGPNPDGIAWAVQPAR